MKKKKLICVLLFSLFCTTVSAFAEQDLRYANEEFTVVPLGKIFKVVPKVLRTPLVSNQVNVAECENIAREIHNQEYLFERCSNDSSLSICRLLRKRLRLLGEGRADTEIPVDQNFIQDWQIGNFDDYTYDKKGLKSFVAQTLGASEESIEVVVPRNNDIQPKMMGELKPILGGSSLMQKISEVINFESANFGQLVSGKIVTANKILACDLLKKNVGFEISAETNLERVEKTPEEIVQTIWDTYSKLRISPSADSVSPLIQAATIGYNIALALPTPVLKSAEPLYSPGEVFARLYDTRSGSPKLKDFYSIQSMQKSIYPDKNFHAKLIQNWRLQ